MSGSSVLERDKKKTRGMEKGMWAGMVVDYSRWCSIERMLVKVVDMKGEVAFCVEVVVVVETWRWR
jgi:hypothetical protein